jgi:hypothetical protein
MADYEKKISLSQKKYFFFIGFCQEFNRPKYGHVIAFLPIKAKVNLKMGTIRFYFLV